MWLGKWNYKTFYFWVVGKLCYFAQSEVSVDLSVDVGWLSLNFMSVSSEIYVDMLSLLA